MAQQKANLMSLNKVLPAKAAAKDSKRRNVTDKTRHDRISEELAKCNTAAEIGNLAMKFGMNEQEVRQRAKDAKNFGLFRMVVGNRIRGIANKIVAAKKKNVKLSPQEAAYPSGNKAKKVTKKTTK